MINNPVISHTYISTHTYARTHTLHNYIILLINILPNIRTSYILGLMDNALFRSSIPLLLPLLSLAMPR